MSSKLTYQIALAGLVALLLTAVLVATLSGEPNTQFKDATAAITFTTGAALGIERLMELMWTIVGGLKGTFWPLTLIGNRVESFVEDLNQVVQPIQDELTKEVDALKLNIDEIAQKMNLKVEEVQAILDQSIKDVERFEIEIEKLNTLIKDASQFQKAQILAAAASRNIDFLYARYGELIPKLIYTQQLTHSAVNGLNDFLASFKDNPARRLISLYLGAILGLIVSGIFELDVFVALLEDTNTLPEWVYNAKITLIATGLLIGFGAGPTHEIIRFIQKSKEQKKLVNTVRPNLPSLR